MFLGCVDSVLKETGCCLLDMGRRIISSDWVQLRIDEYELILWYTEGQQSIAGVLKEQSNRRSSDSTVLVFAARCKRRRRNGW